VVVEVREARQQKNVGVNNITACNRLLRRPYRSLMSEILLQVRRVGAACLRALAAALVFSFFWAVPVLSQSTSNEQLAQADIILAKIVSGRASLSDIKSGLSVGKPGDTANLLHALHTMRDSLIVTKLLHAIWYQRHDLHPDIPWERLELPLVRVALASTLNRTFGSNTAEFLDYIREQRDNEIFLVRSQVAVALGMNGDPQDIDTLAGYVSDKSDHVAKSAITGLAFMYNAKAREELIHLLELQSDNDKRARLIRKALLHTYSWAENQ